MVVRELIELLQAMPQDALVITSLHSDYVEVERDDIALMEPSRRLISHNGHLMILQPKWWPAGLGPMPTSPTFITAVHFAGN